MDDLVVSPTTSLAPGFRFHPTDEELVRYYLRRKVCGKSFRLDAISDVEVYKCEPWDLPEKSRLKSRDLEWYFFSVLDKKFGNGSRTNRATGKGYWKTTGKDREVLARTRTVGMKKTLVYHIGRAPRGERTNWVMHEYRLVDEELKGAGIEEKDAFVLCRIFQKSGSGPKNGAQYGAPFIEEEWVDDELVMFPREDDVEDVLGGDGVCVAGLGLEQSLDAPVPPAVGPLPNYHEDNRNSAQSSDSSSDGQKLILGTIENQCDLQQTDKQNLFHMPTQHHMEEKRVSISEPSNTVDPKEPDYLLDEPFVDANDNLLFNDGSFLETNDLSYPIETDQNIGMLDEYLSYFDADGDMSFFNDATDLTSFNEGGNLAFFSEGGDLTFFNEGGNGSYCMGFDSTMAVGNEKLVSEGASISQEQLNGGIPQVTMTNEQQSWEGGNNDAASSSKLETPQVESDVHYPYLEQASRMLGSIGAPPAFAAEFPTKDAAAALRLISTSQSSSSAHIAAGMIDVRNATISDWSVVGKHGNINILLSFDVNSESVESMSSILVSKIGSAMSRLWLYPTFVWGVLFLSMSYKMATLIY